MVYEPDISKNPFGHAHPILILGIGAYVASFLTTWVPGWLGIGLIFLGSIASVYNLSQGV